MEQDIKEDKVDKSEKGFYCKECDCVVKDSLNYFDHINGKRHNRNLGISLKKFTDSTLEEVKAMLELKRREREEKLCGYKLEIGVDDDEEERMRQLRREKKKRQKARRMIGGKLAQAFGENDDSEDENDDEDDEEDTSKSGQVNEGGRKSDSADDQDDMMKLMGFANFSSSKK